MNHKNLLLKKQDPKDEREKGIKNRFALRQSLAENFSMFAFDDWIVGFSSLHQLLTWHFGDRSGASMGKHDLHEHFPNASRIYERVNPFCLQRNKETMESLKSTIIIPAKN